jgi:hypothetical protein
MAARINIDDVGFYPAIEDSVMELSLASPVPIYSSWVSNYQPPSERFLSSPFRKYAGVHLNWLEGPSATRSSQLCDAQGNFCRRWVDFLYPSRRFRLAVEAEMEIQCQKIFSWFGLIDHCDSHLHLHSLPWIYRLVQQARRKFAIDHVRNPHEPLSDGPSLHPKLLLLKFLSLLHRSSSLPCYGISQGFRNTREQCVRVLRKGDRELVLHTQSGPFEGNPADFRFLPRQQIPQRQQEHRQMLALVRSL